MDKCPKCGKPGLRGLSYPCGSRPRLKSAGVTESVKCLRRQLAQRDETISRVTASWERLLVKVRRYREEIVDARARIAELEAKLAAAAALARDSAEQAMELTEPPKESSHD